MPFAHREGNFGLGGWVGRMRGRRRRGELSAEQVRILESFRGWVWDPPRPVLRVYGFASWYRLLKRFVARKGHAQAPDAHEEGGRKLGAWIGHCRRNYKRGRLPPAQVRLLEALPGWTWGPRDDRWAAGLRHLRRYVRREGHARVPAGHVEGGFPLGRWVHKRRARYRRRQLPAARARVLETLPGWSWRYRTVRRSDLDEALAVLGRFVAREGHARAPRGHVEDGLRLGDWIHNRRRDYKKGGLSTELVRRLERLPGWSWNPPVGGAGHRNNKPALKREPIGQPPRPRPTWSPAGARLLQLLRQYAEREGHTRVPAKHREAGYRLGQWVASRRYDRRKGRLTDERVRALDALPGWTWDPTSDRWRAGLAALRRFVAHERHARVPRDQVEGGFALGEWVHDRRNEFRAGNLSAERRQILESMPAWAWDVRDQLFGAAVRLLKQYVRREGHARVPQDHVEDGFTLGSFVAVRRRAFRKGKLSRAHRLALESIPGWSWRPAVDRVGRALTLLKEYVRREGHARVPHGHVEEGFRLGNFVEVRRRIYRLGRLPVDQRRTFERLPGWVWRPSRSRRSP